MCNKLSFTKKQSELAIKKAKKSSKQYRKECRNYYCEECNAWHLTSKEEFVEGEENFNILYKDRWDRLLKDSICQKRDITTKDSLLYP